MQLPAPSTGSRPARPLAELPKAHLHLHFTGAMRHATLVELADAAGVALPRQLREDWPPELSGADERGWFRFQRLYDVARSVLRSEDDVRRLVDETVADEVTEGSRWLEIQVDPSGYTARFDGLVSFTELVLDALGAASSAHGVGVGLVVAANRTRHEQDSRTLARLAARFAGSGVVGFGLSNDERRAPASGFAHAFGIARKAGLLLTPHGGELLGADSVRECLDVLGADRLGHGVHAADDADVLAAVVDRQVGLELCPASNVSLGVYPSPADVPLRRLFDAGALLALGADDPLLFGRRLVAQYAIARHDHGFTDAELAELARRSFLASTAPPDVRRVAEADIGAWLAA
jgi:adenosine deaminase